MKFVTQKEPKVCGPVAFINAFIWSGSNVTYENSIDYFKKLLKYDEDSGVELEVLLKKFEKGNAKWPFKVVDIIDIPSIDEIKEQLQQNRAIMLAVNYKKKAHIGLVIDANKTHITVVNWYAEEAVRKVHINTVRNWLKKYCIAFVIEKNKKD